MTMTMMTAGVTSHIVVMPLRPADRECIFLLLFVPLSHDMPRLSLLVHHLD